METEYIDKISKKYSKWVQQYPDLYYYPIPIANRIFERDRWNFFKRQSKIIASNKIQYLRILVLIKRIYY